MDRSWAEVAAVVRERRQQLGRSQQGVVERANEVLGPKSLSEPSVRVFEKAGRDGYRQQTLTAIAVGVDWPADAIERLRSGENPLTIGGGETPASAPPWEELLESQRRVTEALERLADKLEDRP